MQRSRSNTGRGLSPFHAVERNPSRAAPHRDAGAGGGIHGGREAGRPAGAAQGAPGGDAQAVPGVPAARRRGGAVRVRPLPGAALRGGGGRRARPVPAVRRGAGGGGGAGAVDPAPRPRAPRHGGRGAALARVVRAAGARPERRVPVPARAQGGLHVPSARPAAAGAALGALLPRERGPLLHTMPLYRANFTSDSVFYRLQIPSKVSSSPPSGFWLYKTNSDGSPALPIEIEYFTVKRL